MSDQLITKIEGIKLGKTSIKATITSLFSHRIRNGSFMIEAIVTDDSGSCRCIWFNKSQITSLVKGNEYVFTGNFEYKYGRLAFQKPTFKPTGRQIRPEKLTHTSFVQQTRSYSAQPRKSKSLSNVVQSITGIVFWFLLIGGGFVYAHFHNQNTTVSIPNSSSSGTPSQVQSSTLPDTSTYQSTPRYQYYWYCWNSGNSSPHHLGYHVSGDHLCSYQELHDAGFAGY